MYASECPDLPSDALADAAYDPATLWTAASIGRVKWMLGGSWALIAATASLLVAGWLGLAFGIFFGNALLVRGAAIGFACGALLEAVLVFQVARRRPA